MMAVTRKPDHQRSPQLRSGRRFVLCRAETRFALGPQTARGHGDSINDIAVHPLRPSLVLTASRVRACFGPSV